MIQDPQELNQVWELNKMAEPNFDPDKYLATKPSTEDFDPDAFLKLIESTFGEKYSQETIRNVFSKYKNDNIIVSILDVGVYLF